MAVGGCYKSSGVNPFCEKGVGSETKTAQKGVGTVLESNAVPLVSNHKAHA